MVFQLMIVPLPTLNIQKQSICMDKGSQAIIATLEIYPFISFELSLKLYTTNSIAKNSYFLAGWHIREYVCLINWSTIRQKYLCPTSCEI